MKTKNIFKIGILSIIFLSFLISPVLKFNTPQAAEDISECEKAGGTCINKRLHCSSKKLKESSLSCGIAGGQQCCVPSDSEYVKPPQSEREEYHITQEKLREESKTEATGTAEELPATQVCSWIVFNSAKPPSFVWTFISSPTEAGEEILAYYGCVIQISVLEGLGKMIGGMINSLTAQILWALNPDTYGGFVKNEGVVKIWTLLRNFMNFALILILIIIAISTILGIKKYRWQEILWKLVLVALLINFSLIITGILLDISHFITYTFINLTQNLNNNESIAQTIMNLYLVDKISGPEKYSSSFDDTLDSITITQKEINKTTTVKMNKTGWGLAWGNFFLVLAGLALMGLFAFITLVAIFFVMIFRSAIIIILLAVSPIAFAAWVLPNTEKFWQLWWGQFTRWCLFPITFAISLYAGIIVLTEMNNLLATMGGTDQKIGFIAMLVQILLFSMFLIGGLIVSIQSGGAAAKVVQKQVSRAGWLAGALLGRKIKGGIVESPTYAKAGQALTSVPLLRGVGQEMLVAGEKTKAARVKEYEKELEQVSLGALKQLEKVNLPSKLEKEAYEKRIALVNKLADMGELGKNSLEFIKRNKDDVRFNKKAIAEAVPHYFKIEEGELVDTGDDIKNKVMALSRIKPDKIRDKTQISDFIENTVDDKKAIAAKEGKTEEEQKAIGEETFEKIIQETVKTLSPAQLAGWWKGISPKYMTEKGWGGKEGKIIKAIEKDPEAKKKFYGEAIPTSLTLREASGVGMPQENKGSETPPHSS